jgi:putative ubiquitin-RnfH superfamily antitoxin RatB of RatAB toxin-antitoxin module
MVKRADSIRVQVCFARPERQILKELDVPHGTTLHEAVEQSAMLREIPEIDLTVLRTGIHGKQKPLDTILRDRDRVEIYRPLIADPKDSRRKRAQRKNQGEASS